MKKKASSLFGFQVATGQEKRNVKHNEDDEDAELPDCGETRPGQDP